MCTRGYFGSLDGDPTGEAHFQHPLDIDCVASHGQGPCIDDADADNDDTDDDDDEGDNDDGDDDDYEDNDDDDNDEDGGQHDDEQIGDRNVACRGQGLVCGDSYTLPAPPCEATLAVLK